jgi:hypothetical protein
VSVAGLGQPGRVDVEVLSRAIGVSHHKSLAESYDLEGLMEQNHLRIVPTRAIHADHVISDGLKDRRDSVRFE